ncbi:hypothetical protein FQA39_LY14422 [Lamprigera yunnana]|nr:hypothetical protein FQA39_LY14422 [Lamprigera yunnana]
MDTLISSQINLKIGVQSTIVETYPSCTKINFSSNECRLKVTNNTSQFTQTSSHSLLKMKMQKYFKAWKEYIKERKRKNNKEIEQMQKLDNFICNLKNYQNQCENEENKAKAKNTKKILKVGQCAHRLEAQKEIIQMQKNKLIEQDRLIQELKLGNINDDVNKTIQCTKKDLSEVWKNCSLKLKCKIKSNNLLENINKDLIELGIKSIRAPKIIQRMKDREMERNKRRQLIFERKKIIDEAKKRAIEMEIAEKRSQDDEERKKYLEDLEKRRKAQLEFYRQSKLNREKYLEDCQKADRFYKRKLTELGFNVLRELISTKQQNFMKSEIFYEINLKRRGMRFWKKYVLELDYKRSYKAVLLFKYKLKKKCFTYWFKAYILSIQHMQVAEDYYIMQLQQRILSHWVNYTCTAQFIETNNMQKATRHYEERIKIHYFYQWRSFPAVMVIERAKEEKKRKWREKVWEILPDYKPVIDDNL